MAVHAGELYVGTENRITGAEVWKTNAVGGPPYNDWIEVNLDGFGDASNVEVFQMASFNGDLYAGTHDGGDSGCRVFRHGGGTSWTQVNSDGFGDSENEETMGIVMGAFFYPYSAMQIPGGWLGDRWGTRRVLPLLAVLWAGTTAAMGLAVGFYSLLIAYVLVGLAQGGLFPCCVITFAHWLPAARRGFAGGTLTSFMSVGGIVAAALTGYLLGYMDWRWVCAAFGVAGQLSISPQTPSPSESFAASSGP